MSKLKKNEAIDMVIIQVNRSLVEMNYKYCASS